MGDYKLEIKEILGPLKESKTSWNKVVARISWGDGPSNIDIRNMDIENNKVGKGISLSDEEADKLCDILLLQGFGSVEEIEKAYKKKKCFKIDLDELSECFTRDKEVEVIIK